jgi:hypothetical protein
LQHKEIYQSILEGCQGFYIDALIFAVGLAEDHDDTAGDAQITQEKIEIEDEAISEALNDDSDEKTCDSVFRILVRNDCTRADE